MNPEMQTTLLNTYLPKLIATILKALRGQFKEDDQMDTVDEIAGLVTEIPLEYEQILKGGGRFWDDVNDGYLPEDLVLIASPDSCEDSRIDQSPRGGAHQRCRRNNFGCVRLRNVKRFIGYIQKVLMRLEQCKTQTNILTRHIFSHLHALISMSHVTLAQGVLRTSSMCHLHVVVVLILFDSLLCALHRVSHHPFHSLVLHFHLPCGWFDEKSHAHFS